MSRKDKIKYYQNEINKANKVTQIANKNSKEYFEKILQERNKFYDEKRAHYAEQQRKQDEMIARDKGFKALHSVNMFVGGANELAQSLLMTNIPSKIQPGNGFNNYVSPQNAFIIKKTKGVQIPDNYDSVIGRVCNQSYTLNELIGCGYTVCQAFHLEGIPATIKELEAIDDLLRAGIIL